MPKKRNSFKKKQEVEIKTKNKHFIKAINTLDDIEKDSEDEFYSQREQILLEDQVSESDSDQEVLALDIDDDDDDDELEEEALLRTVTRHLRKSGDDSQEESEQSQDEGWGKSRKSYYNADEDSQDDELAKEEELEAIRLQKLKVSAMNDEDFLGDSFEQLIKSKAIVPRQTIHPFNHESDDEDEEFPDDLTDAQKYEIMKKSPEIVNFINELESKTSLIQELEFIINENATSIFERPAEFILLKYRLLSIYCTNIAFYLYLRSTCNTRAELNGIKTHPVLSLIANFKELIEKLESNLNGMPEMTEMVNFLLESQEIPKIQDDRSSIQDQSEEEQDLPIESEESQEESEQEVVEIVQKKKSKKQVIQPFIIQSTAPINYKKQTVSDDFCDALEINDVDLDDKKKRKKSLQFQVAKVNKVAENKRMRLMASGGDDDIPFLDKFGRIESEKKDKVLKKPDLEQDQLDNDLDMDFGVESEQEDQTPVHKFNPDEEEALEFYNSIKQAKKQKKIDRQVAHESQPTLDEILIAEENEESLDISKRPANWQILKNKGLTPYRKKENRNPRVKRRNRYESAMKKLNTVKKSAVDRSKMSSYGGEVTGIKTHLSRSTRLS